MENIKEQIEREKLFTQAVNAYKTGHLLLEAATGAGKSLIAIKLIKESDAKWIIVVPKLVLIQNWRDEFVKHGYGDLISHEALIPSKVHFITYTSLEKWADLGLKANLILDEAHNVNERRLVAIKDILNLYPLSAKGKGRGHVIALSGSIDEERRPFLHQLGISSANTVKFTTDHAVDADIVSDYTVLVVQIPLDDVKKQPLRYNKWQKTYNLTEREVYGILDAKYKEVFKGGGDTLFPTLDRMKFLYDLPSKFQAAKLILSQLSDTRRILTFGSSIEQIENLCEYTHHSKKSKKDMSFENFKNGTINRLGAIQTIAEGVNIPNLDTGFIVQAMSKNRHMIQRLGRMLRIDKDNPNKKATLIVLSIMDTQDEKWVNQSLSYFDQTKVHYWPINEVRNLGIEKILSNLED